MDIKSPRINNIRLLGKVFHASAASEMDEKVGNGDQEGQKWD